MKKDMTPATRMAKTTQYAETVTEVNTMSRLDTRDSDEKTINWAMMKATKQDSMTT